jgi:hypothetical protein
LATSLFSTINHIARSLIHQWIVKNMLASWICFGPMYPNVWE